MATKIYRRFDDWLVAKIKAPFPYQRNGATNPVREYDLYSMQDIESYIEGYALTVDEPMTMKGSLSDLRKAFLFEKNVVITGMLRNGSEIEVTGRW